MTREAKISLLIGLAFIIVIGMLLADHMAGSMRPPQAALTQSMGSVEASVGSPGAKRGNPGSVAVKRVEPNSPIDVGGNSEKVLHVKAAPPSGSLKITDKPDTAEKDNAGPVLGKTTDPVGPVAGTEDKDKDKAKPADPPADPAFIEHEAERGDTVSKMALKYYKSNTKPLRELIINANDSLKAKPNQVVVGTKYRIPKNPAETAAKGKPSPAPAPAPAPAPVVLPKPETAVVTYTTKPGDNLWKIAAYQCRDPGLVAKIRELNKDQIGNKDTIRPNITLKLPAKSTGAGA